MRYFAVTLFAIGTCLWPLLSAGQAIQAGMAKINITPTEPTRMSGYGARKEPFKDVHDDLYASAIVFSDGTTKACILASDLIGFSHSIVDEVRASISKDLGIQSDHIMITAAHNHGGPTLGSYGQELSKAESKYVASLKANLAEVAKQADQKLRPVKLGTSIGTCQMNVNRRALHGEGGVWLGRNPDGPCDQDVTVLRVEEESGTLMGLFVNWPCHAVVGGQDNYSITGDWPGAAARELEKTNGDVVVMMTAGASGDINPIYGPNTSFRNIAEVGQTLAVEVDRVSAETNTHTKTGIDMINQNVTVPGKKPSESRMPNVSLESGPEVEIRMSSLRVGDILFAGISGELMTEIGMEVKADSPYRYTFMLTHCNGNSGYLVTDAAYKEGGYEPMVSRTMPGTAKVIRDTFRDINNRH